MKTISVLAILAIAAVSPAVTITQWDFNFGNDANTSTGTLVPSIGTGTAALLAPVTGSFSSGDASGGSSDPNVGDDSAWQTTTYTAQGVGSGTAGIRFLSSTVGFTNIQVMFDTRHSNTSSRFISLDYTLDGGTTWSAFQTYEATNGGDVWYNGRSADLSSVASANNNANFGVRMVSVFAPTTSAYTASTATATYASTGTLRYDMVTLSGTAVPEPATMATLGLGIAALLRRRRKA